MLDVNDRECQYLFNEAAEVFTEGGIPMEMHMNNNEFDNEPNYDYDQNDNNQSDF